ncbi:MAG: HEAT repeat domain-containing protein, partial [Acidobacteriota bacterium]|nr:HEAT repeat domain-containing protein [Acidobacteriota bacterium]
MQTNARAETPAANASTAPAKDAAASRCVRLGLAATLGASLVLFLPDIQHAQQRYHEPAVKVTSVTASGNTVSISADGSLNRAQTWEEPGKFHVVVNGQAETTGLARGVRAERVGNSLELVIPIRQGASVTVEPRGNRLDLVVGGGAGGALNVENFPTDSHAARTPQPSARAPQPEQAAQEQSRDEESHAAQQPASKRRSPAEQAAAATSQPSQQSPQQPTQQAAQPQQGGQATDVINFGVNNPAAQEGPKNSASVPPAAAQLDSGEGLSLASSLFSLPALLALLGVLALGVVLFFVRRRRASADEDGESFEVEKNSKVEKRGADEPAKPFQQFKGDRRKASIAVPFERRVTGRGAEDEASRQTFALGANGASRNGDHSERAAETKAASVAVQFGAYRVDQEVARLIQGQSHSVEVLNSRATDDRRAVETSLLKALRAPETDEDGRRRARTALEDYGFVARACASLLLGPESFERASAAQTLGEMKSARALPFLTEALYDTDPVVRMECVQSLAALGLPSAIGALLDVARHHPDIPATVLGPALTACSVESLELNWDSAFGSRTFADAGGADEVGGEFGVAGVAEDVEALPEWIEDETLQSALERLESSDVESRVHSAQQLAQFQVRRAVEALAAMARQDNESAVRSAAVTSLGLINHESVFAPVILALADDAREVRAAAARALSRLSFDRADAYVRVMESADAEALAEVAKACVKAGLAAQAINRLASEDRRQAYEAFSLLSLCAKAGETQPILDTVECHRDIEVRLA